MAIDITNAVTATVESMRLLMDVVKANKALTNFNEITTAVYEVTAKLSSMMSVALAAQEHEMALSKRVAELEEENRKLKNWEAEADRYILVEVLSGVPVYTPKPGMENGEAAHYLCTNCFSRKQKSFLAQKVMHYGVLECGVCKSLFQQTDQFRKATAKN